MINDRIEMIPLDHIEPSPGNRRIGGFDPAKMEQLAESIRAVGVQQPAVVRPIAQREGAYQLVAGERRWRASRIAGMETLPCVVRELDDVTALKIQYIENLQRDDVHPLDEADGYEQLVAHAGYTIEMLSSEVGKSPGYIYQRMKLASLIDEAKKLFISNTITAGHALLIARLGPDQQKEIMKDLFGRHDDVTIRDLDGYIHNHIMLDLSKITWKKDDAELLSDAGSCQDCQKRTGYQPMLFTDISKNWKKDYCTDKVCFSMKQKCIVEVKRTELAGQDVIEVADGWLREKLPEKVVEQFAWNECKKSDPGAKRILVVAGNQPGRMTWGVVRTSTRYQASPEEKARAKKDQEVRKRAEELHVAKVDAVLEAAARKKGKLPLEALRTCVLKIWDRWWHDHVVVIANHEGWVNKNGGPREEGEKRIKTMNEAQLNRLLLLIAMVDEIKCPNYCKPSSKTIDTMVKMFSAKVKAPEKKKPEKKGSKSKKK